MTRRSVCHDYSKRDAPERHGHPRDDAQLLSEITSADEATTVMNNSSSRHRTIVTMAALALSAALISTSESHAIPERPSSTTSSAISPEQMAMLLHGLCLGDAQVIAMARQVGSVYGPYSAGWRRSQLDLLNTLDALHEKAIRAGSWDRTLARQVVDARERSHEAFKVLDRNLFNAFLDGSTDAQASWIHLIQQDRAIAMRLSDASSLEALFQPMPLAWWALIETGAGCSPPPDVLHASMATMSAASHSLWRSVTEAYVAYLLAPPRTKEEMLLIPGSQVADRLARLSDARARTTIELATELDRRATSALFRDFLVASRWKYMKIIGEFRFAGFARILAPSFPDEDSQRDDEIRGLVAGYLELMQEAVEAHAKFDEPWTLFVLPTDNPNGREAAMKVATDLRARRISLEESIERWHGEHNPALKQDPDRAMTHLMVQRDASSRHGLRPIATAAAPRVLSMRLDYAGTLPQTQQEVRKQSRMLFASGTDVAADALASVAATQDIPTSLRTEITEAIRRVKHARIEARTEIAEATEDSLLSLLKGEGTPQRVAASFDQALQDVQAQRAGFEAELEFSDTSIQRRAVLTDVFDRTEFIELSALLQMLSFLTPNLSSRLDVIDPWALVGDLSHRRPAMDATSTLRSRALDHRRARVAALVDLLRATSPPDELAASDQVLRLARQELAACGGILILAAQSSESDLEWIRALRNLSPQLGHAIEKFDEVATRQTSHEGDLLQESDPVREICRLAQESIVPEARRMLLELADEMESTAGGVEMYRAIAELFWSIEDLAARLEFYCCLTDAIQSRTR